VRVPSTDGVDLELHDLGGDGPALLIAHATGFCAGAYRPLAKRFAELGLHVWALDFRGHGDATSPPSGDMTWRGMADDVHAVVDAIGAGPVLAYGHSMGGAALAAAELARPGTVRRAVLFEPIIIPAEWAAALDGANSLAEGARKRRPGFPSKLDALDRYASRPPLGLFRADALWAYVDSGFADAPDGSVVLKCTPEREADVFDAPGKPTIDEMRDLTIAVTVALGRRDAGRGPTDFAEAVAAAMPHGQVHAYDHVGHFGPFQDPDTLAEDAAAFLLA
jgi:pimeloyl-ACP methyl ester carboxylesterase